jgi:phosphoesterase RecJ-like protein
MIASYIYVGIYTDTNRFFYSCTSQNTFLNMQRLFKHIPNISEINFKLSERTIEELKFQNEIYKIIKFDKKNKIASLKIPKNIFKKYKIENNSMI